MKCIQFWNIATLEKLEATLVQIKILTKFYNVVSIGIPFLKMLLILSNLVINVKGVAML